MQSTKTIRRFSRDQRGASAALIIGIIALILSLVDGYAAFNAMYATARLRAEIEQGVAQAQAKIEALKKAQTEAQSQAQTQLDSLKQDQTKIQLPTLPTTPASSTP